MKNIDKNNFFVLLILLVQCFIYGQSSNIAPILTATGDQIYCNGTSMKIATSMNFFDPDDIGVDAVYIQISTGYVYGQDILTLTGTHPTIMSSWDGNTGKLTLTGVSSQPTYADLSLAIEDVAYSNSSSSPSGIRTFSISIGQANYLPSNGHYYQYIPNIGVTWSDAKNLAQASTYYGLQGYLATITAADEAQLAGTQAAGAGWIGGSDEQSEGTWKWMTGPENGTIFWNGNFTGYTSTFAFWNTGEPNNVGGIENYAHITAPGVGIPGSWNDLSNTGDSSGDYQPKGYIIEYGGMPGDPILHISTKTTITIPSITSSSTETICGSGTVHLQATSNTGIVYWYDAATGGNPIATGNDFITPTITSTTDFFAVAHSDNCPDTIRIPITAHVTPKPTLTYSSPYYMCDESYTVIDVETTSGILLWYDSLTNPNYFFLGTHFVVPNIHQNTTFYAEANYNGCLSDRVPIEINVYVSPIVSDKTYKICSGEVITLTAGNPGMSYLWSTGATSQTITTNGLTNYSVTITTPSPENCSKTENFTIITYNSPTISDVEITDSIAIINTETTGDFEYSIDGVNYQTSNEFNIIDGGLYIAYVREKNGCGIASRKFIVLSIPEFFTPNNDGENDTWNIKGLAFYPQAEVKIFDRYGKFIAQLNSIKHSWDGTLNGKNLISDDYWYVYKIDETLPEVKGHFAMIR
ncbi:MAG: T9SS type B sorting domain-containing protein [Flavobacterium sp.]